MATITARLQLGKPHPYDNGICHGYNAIELYENSNVHWVAQTRQGKVVWLPRTSHTVAADGLMLLTALYMPSSKAGQELSDRFFPEKGYQRIRRIHLPDVTDVDYETLYNDVLTAFHTDAQPDKKRIKLLASVYEGSVLHAQFDKFTALDCDVEILTTSYCKAYSVWGEQENIHERPFELI